MLFLLISILTKSDFAFVSENSFLEIGEINELKLFLVFK